jgi:hypothetical protein
VLSVSIVAMVVIAVAIVAAVALVHYHFANARAVGHVAVVIAPVYVVDRHYPISLAPPMLGLPVMHSLYDDDPGRVALDYDDPPSRRATIGRVFPDRHVPRHRSTTNSHIRAHLRLHRVGEEQRTREQRPRDDAGPHISLDW